MDLGVSTHLRFMLAQLAGAGILQSGDRLFASLNRLGVFRSAPRAHTSGMAAGLSPLLMPGAGAAVVDVLATRADARTAGRKWFVLAHHTTRRRPTATERLESTLGRHACLS